jgi:hypothetical protein
MRTQIQIGSGNRVDPRKRNSNQHCPRLVLFLCMRDSDFCIIPLKKETATKFNKLVFSSKKKKKVKASAGEVSDFFLGVMMKWLQNMSSKSVNFTLGHT